ncbi:MULTISPECIES: diaminopropionate ammonia-lyase [Mesorhizobium]|uniref:Diaminopropionate ammonia-lyase n=1 Tax=Mesorhizobium denitrificans TaxID=2294114 RepID=A0A371X8V4_9HYPH|nr:MULTISPECIES: diaminopropionate ammonia-lyase [Mesorhizobium]RFC65669.1 diaminopropionate ammonia-lyase [Mesorhizobium denitrificans]
MEVKRFNARAIQNAHADRQRLYGEEERSIISLESLDKALAEITTWPGYSPTPLLRLKGLASKLGIGELHYKDEGQRFGLKSFKAIGGAYAVLAILQEFIAGKGIKEPVSAADLISGKHRNLIADVVVAAATDGNHGRSVAWGAKMFGCSCVIYLHEHVSTSRQREIEKYGARIVRVKGHYDDSVQRCAADCVANGWFLAGDTSNAATAHVPSLIMQGYTIIADEIADEMGNEAPTHVFVQAGVGGLAAAIAAYYWEKLGAQRPKIIVIEPHRADCIYRSIAAGKPTAVPGDTNTVMACLAAGEVSAPAWIVLKHATDGVITLPEEAAPEAMRLLAAGVGGDPAIVAGESGCAAVAGLIAATLNPEVKTLFGLGKDSRIVAIGSEGATDEEAYQRIVGRASESVAA